MKFISFNKSNIFNVFVFFLSLVTLCFTMTQINKHTERAITITPDNTCRPPETPLVLVAVSPTIRDATTSSMQTCTHDKQ